MSEPEDNGGRGETLPPGIEEPGSEEPEADALEQQLRPDSGESAEDEAQEPSQERAPGSTPDASDADVVEQERAVEFTEDDYRE